MVVGIRGSRMIDPADVQSVVKTLQRQYDPVLESHCIIDELDGWFTQHAPSGLLSRRQGLFLGVAENVMHEYFVVNGDALLGYPSNQQIIVDPTVQQFNYPSWSAGAVDTYVADSPRELPTVGLFTERDLERDWYVWP